MAVTPAVGERIDVSISGVVVKHDVMNGPRALVELDPTDDTYATKRQLWITATDLGDEPPPPVVQITATAGTPGTWEPPSPIPDTFPELYAADPPVLAAPTTAWTTGQEVLTGDGLGHAFWDGTKWTAGTAP